MVNNLQTKAVSALNRLPRRAVVLREQSLYWPTLLVQSRMPHASGSVFINGFPVSGTNWLCQLTARYLDLPIFEAWTRLTPSFTKPHVFHTHRFIDTPAVRERTIYITRDGRDATLSRYFKLAQSPRESAMRRKFEKRFGLLMDTNHIAEQLPDFIDWYFTEKVASSINWQQHIEIATEQSLRTVRFEGLKADPLAELTPVFTDFSGKPIDVDRLLEVIEARKFDNVRGKGTQHHKRKGAVGEWNQYFNVEARARFAGYAQNELVAAGYENDTSWITRDEKNSNGVQ